MTASNLSELPANDRGGVVVPENQKIQTEEDFEAQIAQALADSQAYAQRIQDQAEQEDEAALQRALAQSAAEHRDEQPDDIDASSFLQVETGSNADLYCLTPPAYAMSAAEGEVSLDAEAAVNEKTDIPGPSNSRDLDAQSHRSHLSVVTLPAEVREQVSITVATPDDQPRLMQQHPASSPIPSDLPPVYFQPLVVDAAHANVKACSVMRNRPAVWSVKRKNISLSPLAATVLIKEGLVRPRDLDLISQSAGAKRDPTDPLSAIAFATYDTVGDVLLGVVEGPIEAGKQLTPLLLKYEKKRDLNSGVPPGSRDENTPRESTPLMRPRTNSTVASEKEDDRAHSPSPSPQAAFVGWPEYEKHAAEQSAAQTGGGAHAAKQVAIGTGKGLGRIVGAGLKAPMTFTHGLARGFHNVPKLYGDETREYENVVDLRSGLSVSAKGFGYGIHDGLKGFFVQPIQGAQKEGVKGLAKGFGKGLGGIVCKPTAGMIGLVGYSFAGVYKELQGLKPGKNTAVDFFKKQGEIEYEQATAQDRKDVVQKWCQVTMRLA
ncbi:hypothetical protein EJ04DRAFT_510838 [Polyplosphaeria fusca]|uniref:Uncharacterized protein n=1 Tax=Polyplosphaeria fusca TaxID=682080 RepID=A0A9P4R4U0_9PLEO|nr:hypothetical protein EJ04DRAFT_510838 [Polyplosphaeria fusca]